MSVVCGLFQYVRGAAELIRGSVFWNWDSAAFCDLGCDLRYKDEDSCICSAIYHRAILDHQLRVGSRMGCLRVCGFTFQCLWISIIACVRLPSFLKCDLGKRIDSDVLYVNSRLKFISCVWIYFGV